MSRPADLPFTEYFQRLPCGTRAKYVAGGCRCRKCRIANGRLFHERNGRAVAAALQIVTPPTPAPQVWTAPDGSKRVRLYARACPGVHGTPCPHHRHLRKDSKGGVCGDCRLQLDWNGLVSTAPVRAHLLRLSRQGVGYKAVADAASVSRTALMDIRAKRKLFMRAKSAQRVLAVDADAIADAALVPAARTLTKLRRLLAEGFTKTELARRLGSKARVPSLQITRGHVLARTALKVERFYNSIMVGA